MPYVSDFTKFINGWLEAHPEEQKEQKAGRALWWDKPQDLASQEAKEAARVPQKPYPYFSVD